MISLFSMAIVLVEGLILGFFFFGVLYWTVGEGLSTIRPSLRPSLIFLGSWLMRFAVVAVAFYFIAAGRWERLMVCVAGFFIARLIITGFSHGRIKREAIDATKSR